MFKITKTVSLLLLILMLSITSYAGECSYTDMPVEYVYTEQGYVWYKQSSYLSQEEAGYWTGNTKAYYGNSTNMYSSTNSGCGPISMATIVTNCRQEFITPEEMIQYFCDTGLYTGNGSSHNSARKTADKYSLNWDVPGTAVHQNRIDDMDIEVEWMKEHLEKGHWIQILVKGTPNVTNSIWPAPGGHFVAIHGYIDGKTYIYDSSRPNYLEQLMDLEEVWKNIRNPLVDGCGKNNHMTAVW